MKKLRNNILMVIAGILIMSPPSFAGNAADESCATSTGAAYGLCTAAWHIGCGTANEKSPKACGEIEDNYFKITGEMPPWLVICPCWTPEILAAQAPFTICGDNIPGSPGITGIGFVAGGFACTGVGCGSSNAEPGCAIGSPPTLPITQIHPIAEEENLACHRQIMALCPNPTY